MDEKVVIFRLTEGRTPASWSIKGGMAIKEGEGLKYMGYYKGSKSIFVDDNTDDRQQDEVVFEYNDILSDPATEIQVPESNKNLIAYLKAHAFFNVHYKIHNEDILSEEKLEVFDKTEKALMYIREEDDLKVKAIALSVFKTAASGWSVIKCRAELKETAFTNPRTIIDAMEDPNYESTYLAALAFYSSVLTENNLHTAVVWVDGQGEVLKLALGENGIEKLGNLLAIESEESRVLLQEIGNRIAKKNLVKNATSKSVSATTKTEEQIREEVRADEKAKILAELKLKDEDSSTEDEDGVPTLEELQAQYKIATGKEVPPRFKNDTVWITAQLESK